ncbi:MAG: iron-sulfur cluster assembly accessory protein [Balneolaceae bacterium]|nr:iron-sulfur cluster assembly accessory protein [Balneolaceae bacterium]MDR9407963.1 iron-sulfur cluster assembly accessory protein [Balneolaceae bacterium]
MALEEENLDDVISSLIDDVDDEESAATEATELPQDVNIDQDPVALTERAARQVREIKKKESLDGELYLRVAVEGGGCSGLSYKLGFDIKTDEDKVVESQGMDIIIDPKHLMYLEGIVIDYPDGLDARGFTFDNPNASESCGCGSSFAV